MILGVCDSAEVLRTMRIVKIVINFIRIIVPIILIITSMMLDSLKSALIMTNYLI